MKLSSEHLDKVFGIEGEPIWFEDDFEPLWVGEYRIDDSHLLREWEQDPENLKARGRAISKAKTGKKRKPFTAEAKANMAAALKRSHAEGKYKKRKSPERDSKGRFINKSIGSKK